MNHSPTNHEPVDISLHVHEVLAKNRQIAIIWSIEDVQEVRPDLSEDQAWEVLQAVRSDHDATLGVSWETLEYEAQRLFGHAPDHGDEQEAP